jgi:hypothetical protein
MLEIEGIRHPAAPSAGKAESKSPSQRSRASGNLTQRPGLPLARHDSRKHCLPTPVVHCSRSVGFKHLQKLTLPVLALLIKAFNNFQQNQGELSSALSKLVVVIENYPDL